MITFHNELPLDHTKSLTYIAKKWAYDIYAYDEGTARLNEVTQYPLCMFNTNLEYYIEDAWRSIGEHLSSEGREINIPVGKTYMELAHG